MAMRKALTPLLAKLTSKRKFYTEVSDYTPNALQAVLDAEKVAMEHQQKYVEPEALMVALLSQQGFAVKILNEMSLVNFIKYQPKTTGSRFTDGWDRIAQTMDVIGAKGLASTMNGIRGYYPNIIKVRQPKSHLDGFLREAKKQVMKSDRGRTPGDGFL